MIALVLAAALAIPLFPQATVPPPSRSIAEAARSVRALDARLGKPGLPETLRAKLSSQRLGELDKIDAAAQASPSDPVLRLQASDAFLSLGEASRALPHADATVRLMPGDSKALLLRATIRARLGDYPSAAKDAKAVLAKNPNNPQAMKLLLLTNGRSAGSQSPLQAIMTPAAPERRETAEPAPARQSLPLASALAAAVVASVGYAWLRRRKP